MKVSTGTRPLKYISVDLAAEIPEQTRSSDDPYKNQENPNSWSSWQFLGARRIRTPCPERCIRLSWQVNPTVLSPHAPKSGKMTNTVNLMTAMPQTRPGLICWWSRKSKIIRELWRSRHCQQGTPLVFSPPRRALRGKLAYTFPGKMYT